MSELPENFNPGAFPDRPDNRDYKYEVPFGAPQIDWEKGFDVEKELGVKLKVEHQDGSASCVGQAFSKYAESLNIADEKKNTDLSAKSVYEQIFLPNGGAYLREGAKAIVNVGISKETTIPSYDNGNPPSESFMRVQTINDEIRKEMEIYQSKEYKSIGSSSPDLIASAIQNNMGGVTGVTGDNIGWNRWDVRPPSTSSTWGHAIYLLAFGLDPDRGKWFDFLNSWGKNWGKDGRGRFYYDEYDFANNAFGIWTLTDQKNLGPINPQNDMIKTFKVKDKPEVFAASLTNPTKLFWVGAWDSFNQLVEAGWLEREYTELDSLKGYEVDWRPLGFLM